MEHTKKTKNQTFEKINKMDKPLARLRKKKDRTHSRPRGRWKDARHTHLQQPCARKRDRVDAVGQPVPGHQLSKLTQAEVGNPRSISLGIEVRVKKYFEKDISRPIHCGSTVQRRCNASPGQSIPENRRDGNGSQSADWGLCSADVRSRKRKLQTQVRNT